MARPAAAFFAPREGFGKERFNSLQSFLPAVSGRLKEAQEALLKRIITAVAAALIASQAGAQCVGTGAVQVCTDPISGSTYNIGRIGNLTTMDGYNPRTGSTWRQDSTTIGNSVWHNGTDSHGRTWNSNSFIIGDQAWTNGTDSTGRTFTCVTTPTGTNCF